MRKPALFATLAALLSLAAAATAQVPGDDTASREAGRAQAGIDQWEDRYGLPFKALAEIGPIVTAAIKETPDAAKKYLDNEEQVAIYCALAKYKSGGLFAALSAVRTELYPALEKVRALEIEPDAPDLTALETEAGKRLEAICQSATADDAARLAKELRDWSEQDIQVAFRVWREELADRIKVKGDTLRAALKTELTELAAAEKQAAEAAMRAEADRLSAEKQAAIEAAIRSDPAGVDRLAASAQNEVEVRMKNMADEMKIAIEAKLKARVEEVAGEHRAGFEELEAAFDGMEVRISQTIADKMIFYQGYKDETDRLRLAATLKVVDRSLAEVTEKLKARSSEIEKAREEIRGSKNADSMIAELQADRRALENKLIIAIKNGDETAYRTALAAFQIGWDEYRAETEKAAARSMSQACARTLAQLTGAKPKISGNIERVTAFMDKCRSGKAPECREAMDWNERLVVIRQKSREYLDAAALVETVCAEPAPDRDNIEILLNKLKNDSEDLRLYGEALAAARSGWAADSAPAACRLALAEVRAGLAEAEKNDLVVLDAYNEACLRSKIDCPIDAAGRDRLGQARSAFAKHKAEYQAAEKRCREAIEETDLGALAATLNSLMTGGQALKSEIRAIRLALGKESSTQAFCRIAEVRIAGLAGAIARDQAAAADWTADLLQIEGQAALKARVKDFGERTASFKKIALEADAACAIVGAGPPSDDLIAKLEALGAEEGPLEADLTTLGAAVDALRSESGILVEAENATRSSTRIGVGNPMAREIMPKWRPPFSGTGDWYLGADKDYLEYDINIPKAGKYRIYARDYFDAYQPRGVRKFALYLDGKSAGIHAENRSELPAGAKSIFAWHQLGDAVDLKAGESTIRVVKEGATGGAVILDAIYLTTGAEAPAEVGK